MNISLFLINWLYESVSFRKEEKRQWSERTPAILLDHNAYYSHHSRFLFDALCLSPSLRFEVQLNGWFVRNFWPCFSQANNAEFHAPHCAVKAVHKAAQMVRVEKTIEPLLTIHLHVDSPIDHTFVTYDIKASNKSIAIDLCFFQVFFASFL